MKELIEKLLKIIISLIFICSGVVIIISITDFINKGSLSPDEQIVFFVSLMMFLILIPITLLIEKKPK